MKYFGQLPTLHHKQRYAHGTNLVEVLLGQAVDGALRVALGLVEPVDELLVLLEELGERHAGHHVLLLLRHITVRGLKDTDSKQKGLRALWRSLTLRLLSLR